MILKIKHYLRIRKIRKIEKNLTKIRFDAYNLIGRYDWINRSMLDTVETCCIEIQSDLDEISNQL